MSDRPKVLMICLDGFTWDIANSFLAEGIMPNLAELLTNGCGGVLNSTVPYETSPAWAAFQTGCAPGKTGIFTFQNYDPTSKLLRINSYDDIKVPTLWELADAAGKTIVSINLPVTYPPAEVKGVIIPGLLCPTISAKNVHPPEVYEKYIAVSESYEIAKVDYNLTVEQFVDLQIHTEEARLKVSLQLAQDIDWDIFCVQIHATDSIQHHLWSALDDTSFGFKPENRVEAKRFYMAIDDIVGSLQSHLGGDSVLTIVASDHGFVPLKYKIRMNSWLKKYGYLKTKQPPVSKRWTAIKDSLKKHFPPLQKLAELYGSYSRQESQPWAHGVLARLIENIDMEQTVAFSLGHKAGLIYINQSDPHKNDTAEKLIQDLMSQMGPNSLNPVIERIMTGVEFYGSESVLGTPDLVLQYNEHVSSEITLLEGEFIIESDCSESAIAHRGTHSQRGAFLIYGAGIKPGVTINADIVDIMPTVLAFMSMPVPDHLDGKVLSEVFDIPPRPHYKTVTKKSCKSSYSNSDDQDQICKKLTDLGYI